MKNKSNKLIIYIGTLQSGGAERVVSEISAMYADHFKEVIILTYYDAPVFYSIDSRVRIECVERITGTISIKVVDDKNNPMENCVINIYDSEGDYLAEFETNENGICQITTTTGTFYYKQVKEIPNYVIDDTVYRFKVDSDNRTFDTIITNERYKGRVAIQAKDIKGNSIVGLKCGIYDENKELIVNIKTNENGQMGAKNLPLGTYYYKLEDKKNYVEFQIKEKDEIVIFNIIG